MREIGREEYKQRFFDSPVSNFNDVEQARGLTNKENDTKGVFNNKIVGKNLIEKKCWDKRVRRFRDTVMDNFEGRTEELKTVPIEVLLSTVVKMMPKQIDGSVNHTFTFADMIARANIQLDRGETIDITASSEVVNDDD